MTTVLILAAGRGSRLGGLTDERPKGLVEFAGRPIIEWQLRALAAAEVSDVRIATGYHAHMFVRFDLPTVHNPNWAETNMVSTLLCARELLADKDDLIVSYSDIVYEPRVVKVLQETKGDLVTVVDRDWLRLWSFRSDDPLSDTETLRLDGNNRIVEIGRKPETLAEVEGQYIGMTKLSAAGKAAVLRLAALSGTPEWPYAKPLEKIHFTDLLRGLIGCGETVTAAFTHSGWLEIDTERDLASYGGALAAGHLDRFCRLM